MPLLCRRSKKDALKCKHCNSDISDDLSRVLSNTRETGRDGRFIAYDNGTVWDTQTKLMWAAKDNGKDINWDDAKSYCENYRGGGYNNWRMPTLDELEELYDADPHFENNRGAGHPDWLLPTMDKLDAEAELHHCNRPRPVACDRSYIKTKLIDITCFDLWSSDTEDFGDLGNCAGNFDFYEGVRYGDDFSEYDGFRVLPVRSVEFIKNYII